MDELVVGVTVLGLGEEGGGALLVAGVVGEVGPGARRAWLCWSCRRGRCA